MAEVVFLIDIIYALLNLDFGFIIFDLLLLNPLWVFIFLLAYKFGENKHNLLGFIIFSIWMIALGDMFLLFGVKSPHIYFPYLSLPAAIISGNLIAGTRLEKHWKAVVTIQLLALGFVGTHLLGL